MATAMRVVCRKREESSSSSRCPKCNSSCVDCIAARIQRSRLQLVLQYNAMEERLVAMVDRAALRTSHLEGHLLKGSGGRCKGNKQARVIESQYDVVSPICTVLKLYH